MRAVVMVLRGRFRQYWKSWLALSVLVALAGGFVLVSAAAGVLAGTNVLAAGPALLAARSHPGQLLRSE